MPFKNANVMKPLLFEYLEELTASGQSLDSISYSYTDDMHVQGESNATVFDSITGVDSNGKFLCIAPIANMHRITQLSTETRTFTEVEEPDSDPDRLFIHSQQVGTNIATKSEEESSGGDPDDRFPISMLSTSTGTRQEREQSDNDPNLMSLLITSTFSKEEMEQPDSDS